MLASFSNYFHINFDFTVCLTLMMIICIDFPIYWYFKWWIRKSKSERTKNYFSAKKFPILRVSLKKLYLSDHESHNISQLNDFFIATGTKNCVVSGGMTQMPFLLLFL